MQDASPIISAWIKSGISKKFAVWAYSYLRAAQMDASEYDLAAFYDRTLTFRESKAALRSQIPLNNVERLAQEQYSRAQMENLEKKGNEEYVASIQKAEQETIREIKQEEGAAYLNQFAGTIKALAKNVIRGYNNSLFVLSEDYGTGKTHAVIAACNEENLIINEDYAVITSHSSPLQLYQLLFQHKDKKVVILDDMMSIFNQPVSLGILKAAMWSAIGGRKVQYHTTSKLKTAPDEFILTARIIVIGNRLPRSIEVDSLLSRSLFYQFSLSHSQKAALLEDFVKLPYANLTLQQRQNALAFLKEQKDLEALRDMNMRLLVKMYGFILQHPEGDGWKRQASLILSYDDELLEVKESMDKTATTSEAVEYYFLNFGKSRASFFRKKAKLHRLTIDDGKITKSQERSQSQEKHT